MESGSPYLSQPLHVLEKLLILRQHLDAVRSTLRRIFIASARRVTFGTCLTLMTVLRCRSHGAKFENTYSSGE
jgi:hypothetical protein